MTKDCPEFLDSSSPYKLLCKTKQYNSQQDEVVHYCFAARGGGLYRPDASSYSCKSLTPRH